MNVSSIKTRISFQVKVLVPVATVMVLLMAVTISLVNLRITDKLQSEAAAQLDVANTVITNFLDIRRQDLLLRYRTIVNEPRFKAITQQADSRTANAFLNELIKTELTNNDAPVIATCAFANAGNGSFARASQDTQLDVEEFQSRSSAAIRRAFTGEPTVDTITVGRRLFNVAAIPVNVGDQIIGVVTLGMEFGADTAAEIKQISRSEILFLSEDRVAASSLANGEFYPALVARFSELSSGRTPQDAGQAHEILLGNQHFVCEAGRFRTLSGSDHLGYLLVSSYEGPFVSMRQTRQMLLAVGLLGMILSTAMVWALIGRVTQPLRQLRDSAEAVGRGDFSRRVEVTSRDECGELAAVFNRMTENIKTSREELEKTVETLKTTQNQLIQSEKLSGIGEFVAGVAHELNNPLTSVMGFAELLQQSDMPEQQRRYLDVIFKSAKRCQKIVQSLLSFARRHAPERKVLCVNEIVESAVEILQYQMRTSNIEVITELDPRLPATEVDQHQMQQVFLNIINNARQAIEAGQTKGCLRITTDSRDGWVRISFQDNGPGIPAENLKKIFNPFFTTKEVGKGTGLGLSLCYGIVSEHGGKITPYSKEGEGATFVIELPITKTAVNPVEKAAAPASAQDAHDGVGKRVLVIDDEDSILQMIREALTLNGYKVDVARDGESALRRLSQYHYDLALCDWKMPGLNGQQIYERLQSLDPEMSRRLIFITGDVVNEKTQQYLRAREKICLSKPFTLVEFRSAINRVIVSGQDQ